MITVKIARKFLKCLMVILLLCFTWPNYTHASSNTTVYVNQTLQTIDGFGASDAWRGGAIRRYSAADQQQILDALFSPSNGAGLSILRNRVPQIESSPGVWDFSQLDDVAWLNQQAMNRGVQKVWSTVWSPPAWMKTNQNLYGGSLDPSHAQDYADYLSRYIREYYLRYGISLYGISIQNEPNYIPQNPYESGTMTGTQFHDFIQNQLTPTFQQDGVSTKVIMPEAADWSEDLAYLTLDDPATVGSVDIVAAHHYGGTLAPFSKAESKGKQVWETEVSNIEVNDSTITDGLRWAREIHDTLVNAHANAWHYWWIWNDGADGEGLINGDSASTTYFINKRLWTIGNFSRFVRPGYVMLDMSNHEPEANLKISAFKDPTTSKTVIVAINSNASNKQLNITIDGGAVGSVTPYRTSNYENLAQLGSIDLNGNTFSTDLAPNSVTTFVADSSTPDTIFSPGIDYKIINRASGKALDASGETEGTLVKQYGFWNGPNQIWNMEAVSGGYNIISKNSGLSLDVIGAAASDGADIQLYNYSGGSNQQWKTSSVGNGYYKIVNINSGKVLDLLGGSLNDGTLIIQSTDNGSASQQWSITPIHPFDPNSVYKLINQSSGKALDAAGTTDGTLVKQYGYWGGANQKWNLIELGNGHYKISSANSSEVLDVLQASTADGANLQLYTYANGANQQWDIVDVGGGAYKLINVNSGKAVDNPNGSTADGTNLQQWEYSGGANQHWLISLAD